MGIFVMPAVMAVGRKLVFIDTDAVPAMTGYTTPSGEVTCSGVYTGGREGWRVFDDLASSWLTPSGQTTGWIAYEFPNEKIIQKYTVKASTAALERTPKNWTFEAYDGSGWVVLHSVTNATGWSVSEKREYLINNDTKYKKYRLYVTATNGGEYIQVDEIEMMEAVWR